MNPLLLLLSLLGVGAATSLFSSDGEDTEARSLDKPDDAEPDVIVSKGVTKPEEDVVSVDTTDPGPAPVDPTPSPPEQTGGTGTDGGDLADIPGEGTLEVIGGRVTTIEAAGDDVASVRIVSGVEHGKVTVNPDNTMSLVMTLSDFTGSQGFTYEVTHSDGSTTTHDVGLKVVDGPQEGGWGTGSNHYMLATDENDRVIVEHGENHVKVYVSGSSDALSLSEIAAANNINLADVSDKWMGQWLADNGYGQDQDQPLDAEAGKLLWQSVTPRYSETSNWLLFEKGYEYDVDRLIMRYVEGESELNPIYIGAWGEGDKPVINGSIGPGGKNIVIQDLAITGGISVSNLAENVIVDNVTFTLDGLTMSGADSVTIRNSEFFDIYHDESTETGHVQGLFGNGVEGLLLEGNIFDLNGWHPELMDATMFNHNIYLGHANTDVTVRDTISMRGSSVGIMVRSGGFIEDNAAIDNNVGMNALGGDYKDFGPIGNYTLFADNLVTSAGYHEDAGGAMSMGIDNKGYLTSLVDNIVAHLADPNNYDEFLEKYWISSPVSDPKDHFYDDTIIWNWLGSRSLEFDRYHYDTNVEGLNPDILNQTTIQLFTEALLGKDGATIDDLGTYLRAQADGTYDDIVDADLIIRYFQEGYGIAPELRSEAETLRFVPDELGEGVRWDNRLNWSTDDLPGTIAGDSVDLGGNDVIFGGNAAVENMEMGDNGRLMAHNGKLTVEGEVTTSGSGGAIEVHGSGQVWVDGHTGTGLDIEIDSGRFANIGHMQDADLDVHGGEVILGSDGDQWEVDKGHSLSIFDAAAKVGFDGDNGGIAVLDFDTGSTARFSAESGNLGKISEFRSGAFGDEPDVLSGIDLEGATLEIDLAGLSAEAGSAFTLMSADEIAGVLAEANIAGLGAKDATIVVDYAADTVRLELTNGSGLTKVTTVGDETDVEAGHDALWAALTADHGVADESVEVFDEEGAFAIAV